MIDPRLSLTDIVIAPDGRIKLGGATCGRVVVAENTAYYEYKDRNRHRSADRGCAFVRLPWRVLVDAVEEFLGSAVM